MWKFGLEPPNHPRLCDFTELSKKTCRLNEQRSYLRLCMDTGMHVRAQGTLKSHVLFPYERSSGFECAQSSRFPCRHSSGLTGAAQARMQRETQKMYFPYIYIYMCMYTYMWGRH